MGEIDKQTIDIVNAALFGRMVSNDLCNDFEELSLSISKQTNINHNIVKVILLCYNDQACTCAKVLADKI